MWIQKLVNGHMHNKEKCRDNNNDISAQMIRSLLTEILVKL